MICRGQVDKNFPKYLDIKLSKSYTQLFERCSFTFLLAHNVLMDLSTFPQFAAKLISLYLFSIKIREKLP